MSPIRACLVAVATCAVSTIAVTGASFSEARAVVRIATQSPLSERYQAQGQALASAVKLAVEQRGRSLSRRGLAVEAVPFDDHGTAPAGVDEARRIAADPAIVAVIGPLNSDVALAVAPIYRDAGLAMISPSATHPALTTRGLTNVFRLCGRDDVQADVAARFIAKTLRARTVYVVHDDTVYGAGNAEWFRSAAQTRGLTIVAFEGAPTETQARELAPLIRAKAPDALYVAGPPELAAPLFTAARRTGVRATFVGADALDSSDLVKQAGDAARGTYYTSVAGPVGVHPQARGFAYDYRKRFGDNPEPFATQAYDAATLVLDTLAKTFRGGTVPSREAMVAALHSTRYMGLTGPIAFDEHGDLRRALYLVMKVTVDDPDDWDDNRELKRLGLVPPRLARERMD
jgi:branched-chain amino acid transport system substrate-binding protein